MCSYKYIVRRRKKKARGTLEKLLYKIIRKCFKCLLTEQQSLNFRASGADVKLRPHSQSYQGSRQCTKQSVAGQIIVPKKKKKY